MALTFRITDRKLDKALRRGRKFGRCTKILKKIREILELIKLAKYYKMSTFKEDQYFHKTRAENFE